MGVTTPFWLFIFFGLCFIVIILIDVLCRFLNFRAYRNQKTTILELTPPHSTQKTPEATEHFFSVLHTVASHRSLKKQLLGRNNPISFEVVSSRKQGIRYLTRIPVSEVPIITQQLAAYLPDVKFKETDDYIEASLQRDGHVSLMNFAQSRHFAYPLATHSSLNEHDPIAYLTGSMTKLQPHELIAFQLIVSPSTSHQIRRVRNQLIRGQLPKLARLHWPLPFRIIGWSLKLFFGILKTILEGIGEMITPSYELPRKAHRQDQKVANYTNSEQAVFDAMNTKLAQPLYQANMRVLVLTDSPERHTHTSRGVLGALGVFTVPGYQSLLTRRNLPGAFAHRLRLYFFRHRLPSPFMSRSMQLAVSETAALYHFPYAGTTKTENVVTSMSKSLPAAISLKDDDTPLAVAFGENQYHGSTTLLGLTEQERERHMYIIGGTGSGKTTMLKYQIVQDIQNDKGVAIVDPHGDLAEELLEYIPKDREKDLIYLNPDDLDHPIGVNLLELPEGLEGNDLLREKDRVTESVVSVMRKIFSEDDSGGHRIEYILRNTVHTALTLDKPTLFTIFRLLNDGKFAKSAIKDLEDEDLKAFWKNELGKAGSMQKVKMAAGITAKIGRFLFSASARAMLGQEKSTINFDEILDGKILICNFSKGRLGEDTSMLFGVTILAKLQLAALKRSEKKQSERKPFYLYVDEFQNFATMSFTQMLSEARKYKVFLTMAEQSTQQQDDQKMVNIILANVGTVVAFHTGSPKDEELLLPLFEPYVEKGEIANLPAYNFYSRISGIEPQEPMSGETIVIS